MTQKNMKHPRAFRIRTVDEWERDWRLFTGKAPIHGYELPLDTVQHERSFLAQSRTPEREMARLKRIQGEFARGFRALYRLGPAVTVFGSARFKLRTPITRWPEPWGPNWLARGSRRSPEAGQESWRQPIAAPTKSVERATD